MTLYGYERGQMRRAGPLLAQPVIWVASLSILVGILPLRGARGRAIAAQSHGPGRAWYRA